MLVIQQVVAVGLVEELRPGPPPMRPTRRSRLLLLPINLVAAILRLAGFDQARDAVGSVFVLAGLCVFAYQIVLAAVAVRVHYRVSTVHSLGAMSLTLVTVTLIAGILMTLLLLLVAIFFVHGFGGPCCL
jgi:hypothetical protein